MIDSTYTTRSPDTSSFKYLLAKHLTRSAPVEEGKEYNYWPPIKKSIFSYSNIDNMLQALQHIALSTRMQKVLNVLS